MISSDVLIRGLLAKEPHPEALKVFDAGLGPRTYGLMVRNDNAAFDASAAHSLKQVMNGGSFEAISARWFEAPVQPDGINLMIPMGPELRQPVQGAK